MALNVGTVPLTWTPPDLGDITQATYSALPETPQAEPVTNADQIIRQAYVEWMNWRNYPMTASEKEKALKGYVDNAIKSWITQPSFKQFVQSGISPSIPSFETLASDTTTWSSGDIEKLIKTFYPDRMQEYVDYVTEYPEVPHGKEEELPDYQRTAIDERAYSEYKKTDTTVLKTFDEWKNAGRPASLTEYDTNQFQKYASSGGTMTDLASWIKAGRPLTDTAATGGVGKTDWWDKSGILHHYDPVMGTWEEGGYDQTKDLDWQFTQKQYADQLAQQQAELLERKTATAASKAAQPMSWLEYYSYVAQNPEVGVAGNRYPTVQPWMIGMTPLGTAQMNVNQPIQGWNPQGGDLPDLQTPSANYAARMNPDQLAQYFGYQQWDKGWTPQRTQWEMQNVAPPSNRNSKLNWI